MFGLQVLVDAQTWQPAQIEWEESVGWHYRLTPQAAGFLFIRDAFRAACRVASNCDVTVAVVDDQQQRQIHMITPSWAVTAMSLGEADAGPLMGPTSSPTEADLLISAGLRVPRTHRPTSAGRGPSR